MKVTISELRSMIREALEETTMETRGPEEIRNMGVPPDSEVIEQDPGARVLTQEGWGELEEAWDELEEVSGLHEAKEAKKASAARAAQAAWATVTAWSAEVRRNSRNSPRA